VSAYVVCLCCVLMLCAAASMGRVPAMRVLLERGADLWALVNDVDLLNADASVRELMEEVNHVCSDTGIFTDPEMSIMQWYKAYAFLRFCSFHLVTAATATPPTDTDSNDTGPVLSDVVANERQSFELHFGRLLRSRSRLHACSLDRTVGSRRQALAALAAAAYRSMARQPVPMPLRAKYVGHALALFFCAEELRDLISLRSACRATSQGRFPVLRWQKELEEGLVEEFLGGEGCRFVHTSSLHRAIGTLKTTATQPDIPD
jgi:hypothetical protein